MRVGVYGATGYTGLELMTILNRHPLAELVFATSESMAGHSLRASHPQAPAITLMAAADAPLDAVDVVFLCLPHTASADKAAQALAHGVKVVDLSADFRLNDATTYERWYKVTHPHPELLPTVYGLPEINRAHIAGQDLIANPGCYATSLILGLCPLIEHLQAGAPIIADSKSGVSGAGRTPKAHTVYGEVAENFAPYAIGRAHRHLAEVEQVLGLSDDRLIFSPHLLPIQRGILSTIYVQVEDVSAASEALRTAYAAEVLVDVLPAGELATIAHVSRTPKAALSLTPANATTLIVTVAIDNLLKGAASQAVQNLNLMVGYDELGGLV